MSRNLKIAGVAALAGMMLTVGIVSASRPAPKAEPVAAMPIAPADAAMADIERCRTITMPDSGCEAAWEAKRRHFFGRDEKR
ncbi:putative entry exclusion protein TrbK-alt [Blastomonas sp. UPD001]|uniref:putative entry exclusion protein TrbK-alt n=1 Tax=Blastomonas sp. UPD001 TaxID=2217673 RepID=UPI000E343309|nr:putative entry exclusion protein TrbK-alt [Blastomonas sp. UPD001]